MSHFNFASVPGCVLWLERDTRDGAEEVVDQLHAHTGQQSEHYIWEDPNNPGRSLMLAFNHVLTDAERAQVEEALVAHYNPTEPPG